MPQLTRSELETAYRLMRTIREFEERLHLEFESGEIPGFVHLYAGEEASAVGVCMNLAETDRIASTHRGHGHSIAKGCDVKAMMKEIYGRVGGLCQGKGGSMHIADFSKGMMGANGIVGGGPPLACGAALSAKTLGTGGVAVAFVGDGGANQGTTAEALCLAAVWELPVIFVVEDNGYGQMNASSWALSGDLVTRAEGFGVAARRVCGHNFFAVHEAACSHRRVSRRARPTLWDCAGAPRRLLRSRRRSPGGLLRRGRPPMQAGHIHVSMLSSQMV